MSEALLLLLLVTLVLVLAVDRFRWVSYTLTRDLPWIGVVGSGLALLWARRRRGSALRRLGGGWLESGHRARSVALVAWGLVALALVASTVVTRATGGLSLRTGSDWSHVDPTQPTRRVTELTFSRRSGGPWIGEHFSATLSGWIYAPAAGRYRFRLETTHAALLLIDGQPVAAAGTLPDPAGTRRGTTLTTGFHRVELRYLQETGQAWLRLFWTPPGASRPWPIAREYLLPDDASPGARLMSTTLLGLRRVAAAALVILLVALGTTRLIEAVERFSRWTPRVTPGAAPRALLLLLFFFLTDHPRFFAASSLVALWAGLLALLLASPWMTRLPTPRVLGWLDGRPPRVRTAFALATVLIVQLLMLGRFLGWIRGQLLIFDDYGSFLYAYHVLDRIFPRLLPYDPWWNAGTLDDSHILTGAALVFVLTWPLTRLVPLMTSHAWFVPTIVIFVGPWSAFAATRLLGLSRLAAVVAALLALAPTREFFFWLGTGSLPFLVAVSWVPLLFALAWRVFVRHDWRPGMVALLAAVATLGSLSPFFPFMVLPALVAGALILRGRLRPRDLGLAAAIAILVLLIHAGWLTHLRQLPTLSAKTPASGWLGRTEASIERLTDVIATTAATQDPLGLAMGIAALLAMRVPWRWPYVFLLGSLVLVRGFGTVFHPQVQLGRLSVVIGFALIPLAAAVLARMLRSGLRSGWAPQFVLVGTLLVLSLHVVQSCARYDALYPQMRFLPDNVRDLAEWLRRETSLNARILLAGRVVHHYTGHVAYLQLLTGRPMVANCHYSHAICRGISPTLQEDDATLRRYLGLFNIRYAVTTDPMWGERLERLPGVSLRKQFPGILVYETDVQPSYFLEGQGTVGFDYNRLAVRLDAPAEAVVLKFRWVEGLRTEPLLPMDRVEVRPGQWFIRIHPSQTRAFEILY